MITEKKKTTLFYLAGYLIIWLILFEFFLPVNKILPRPSIVVQSFPSLISDYSLLPNYISSVAVIYLSLATAYFTVKYLSFLSLLGNNGFSGFVSSIEWLSFYVPGILWGILLLFWFPASEYTEFIYAFLAVLFNMLYLAKCFARKVPDEYLYAARSLALSGKYIRKNIAGKIIQAGLLSKLNKIHISLWLLLIAFEFIKGGYGLGNIFQRSLLYKDMSAFFSGLVITGLTIFIGSYGIKYIVNKKLFWK